MPEFRLSPARRGIGRLAPVFMAALLVGTFVPVRQAAAHDGFLDDPAPFPVRGGGVKGDGEPSVPEPTGRLIVRYRDGMTDTQRARVRAADRLELVAKVALPNTELVTPAGGVSQAISRLEGRPDVLFAEPEYRRTHMAGPTTEPRYPQQWALSNTGQTVIPTLGRATST